MHNGQVIPDGAAEELYHGLFGSYEFYQHMVSTMLLPLDHVVRVTEDMKRHGVIQPGSTKLLFAASQHSSKYFFCDMARRTETNAIAVAPLPTRAATCRPLARCM